MTTRMGRAAVKMIVLSSLSGLAMGQETTGSISGTVLDASGAAVSGATVTLTNKDRGAIQRTLKTNSKGFYTGTSLPLGNYSVKVEDSGFKTEVEDNLVLHVNDALTVNRTLVPGSEGETVTVQADQVQLNLEDATSSGLISGTQARELVLNNRNYEQLIQLQPGVAYGGANDQLYVGATVPSGSSNTVNFSVNGGRAASNNWTIDGADNVDRGSNLTLLVYPSVDAIAEFKTLRGQYTAQFGRSSSGQINVVTKSGTNQIHGTAYEFFRNDYLNANTYFNKLTATTTARPKLRYNDFGGTMGGPVYIPHLYDGRDKTFFFFSEESRRVIQYVNGNALVPTAAERGGDFSNDYYSSGTTFAQGPVAVCTAYNPTTGACTTSGTKVTNISPTAAAYLKDLYSIVPLPNSAADVAAGLDPHTVNSTARNQFGDDQILVRIDQQVGRKLNLFYRYVHDTLPVISGTGTFTTVPLAGVADTTTKQPGTTQMGHATYVFTPTLLLDMGYAYSSGAIFTDPTGALTTANSPDVKPALPYTNTLGVIPTLGFSGFFTGLGSTGIYRDYNINHSAFGSLTKTLGRHTLITGVTYDHYQKRENSTGGNQGGFSFNTGAVPSLAGSNTATSSELTFANFLLGNANGGANSGFSQTSLAIVPNIQENIFEGFVQDNWKANRRLTLNVGVRYSYFGQPIDGNGRLSNFDPALYDASKAPTIDSTGLACFVAPCKNTNGQGSATPNANADYQGVNYLNGIISGGGTVAGHASPFGSKVGQADNHNLAPRLGFAYDVFGDGRTAFRGGYGWSFDESAVSYYETAVFNNPPAVSTFTATTANLDNPSGGSAVATKPSATPGRLLASPLDYHTPYVQQYSLDIQQEITPTLMLDVGYFGTHGTHLLGLVDINESQPGAFVGKISPTDVSSTCVYPGTTIPAYVSTLCDRGLNQIKPYRGYFAIDAVRSIFSSNYNSLQVKVTKRFGARSLLDANYTWSRDLTNSQNDYSTPPQNTYNINGDYGRAAIDRTNILTIDGVYDLPFYKEQKGLVGRLAGGWEVSGIYAINSGLPLTVTESTGGTVFYGYTSAINGQANGNVVSDAAGIGISGNTNASFRPNLLVNPNNGYGRNVHNRQEWFYRGAFSTPLPGSYAVGNEKRGVITGPGFNRLDIGIFRNFKIWEQASFQLRGEAFNVINHTNFQAVNVSATSTSFGQVVSARDNRILQVSGKINF